MDIEKENIVGIAGVDRNITEGKKAEDYARYLSLHDHLTGLYNHRFFEEELTRLDVNRNLPLGLIIIDVNGLKLVNDAFGHKVGDKLLQKIAENIKKECRSEDIVARIGGDEFGILLPKTTSDEIESIIKRINKTMESDKTDHINTSVSYGWEVKVYIDEDISDVYKKAESFMYRDKASERSSVRYEAIRLIMKTLYDRIPREKEHANKVSQLCKEIGKVLNLDNTNIQGLRMAGLLHDIGKIIISDEILNKKEPLDKSEWMEIKRHPEVGYNILSSVNEYATFAESILAHHENWDGMGYPKGLKGEEIPLISRIIKVADAYEAMTSDKPYRKALNKEEALKELKKYSGIQFDSKIVKVLIGLYGEI